MKLLIKGNFVDDGRYRTIIIDAVANSSSKHVNLRGRACFVVSYR